MIGLQDPNRRLVVEWQQNHRRDEASRALFERHAPRVARFFERRGFAREHCRDLTQEVFLRVFRSLPSFGHEASFETWLFKIVRNVWKNALRHRQTQKRAAAEEIPLEEARPHPFADRGSAGALDRILVQEERRNLRDAVAEMPPDLKRLLICQIHQELKVSEISSLLKIPEGTVKSRLSKARNILRKKLKHLAPEGRSP